MNWFIYILSAAYGLSMLERLYLICFADYPRFITRHRVEDMISVILWGAIVFGLAHLIVR